MKIGLVISFYNELDFIKKCLEPWIAARKNGVDLKIALLDGCFNEFEAENNSRTSTDGSAEIAAEWLKNNDIDFFQQFINGEKECAARNIGLNYLLEQDVDVVITWGLDEIITENQILKLVNFIKGNPLMCWFKINYKNFVFTDDAYLLDFAPPRVFRVKYQELKLKEFYFDDDVLYFGNDNFNNKNVNVDYKRLSCSRIPVRLLLVNHYTWLNNERSKKKVEYQSKHFQNGFGCAFKWNNDKNCLEWNEDYYKKLNQSIPTLLHD